MNPIPRSKACLIELLYPTYLAPSFALASDYRMIVPEGLSAARTSPAHTPKASSDAAKQGLRYEKRVRVQLAKHVALGHFVRLEHNPWFSYADRFGSGYCSPDFLLWRSAREVIIVEVKLTWVVAALGKIMELYKPVVEVALGVTAEPLVIVRNLTLTAPPIAHTLRGVLENPITTLQYFDNGPMIW